MPDWIRKKDTREKMLIFSLLIIWLACVYLGPMFFCESGVWLYAGIGGAFIGVIGAELNNKERKPSISACHLGALLGYCFVALMLIGFSGDATYSGMKDLGMCAIYYSTVTIIVSIAEYIYEQKKESKKRKEEWRLRKQNTQIEVGRLFVRTRWDEYDRKPELKHILKPEIESEDVWEVTHIGNEDITLLSCINGNGTKTIDKNDLIWFYSDISYIFDSHYNEENDLLSSYQRTMKELKKKEKNIKFWVDKKKGKD